MTSPRNCAGRDRKRLYSFPVLAMALALLATPALADDMVLSVMGNKLDRPAAEGGHVSAVVACLLGGGDIDLTLRTFERRGWTGSHDTEMGLIDLTNPAGDLAVTLADDGSFCTIASERRGTTIASQVVTPMLLAGSLSLDTTTGPLGCQTFLPKAGVTIEITSTGQDPSCASDTTSAIRMNFGG